MAGATLCILPSIHLPCRYAHAPSLPRKMSMPARAPPPYECLPSTEFEVLFWDLLCNAGRGDRMQWTWKANPFRMLTALSQSFLPSYIGSRSFVQYCSPPSRSFQMHILVPLVLCSLSSLCHEFCIFLSPFLLVFFHVDSTLTCQGVLFLPNDAPPTCDPASIPLHNVPLSSFSTLF